MTTNHIHFNELKIIFINIYAILIAELYLLLIGIIGNQDALLLFLGIECILLCLIINLARKRKLAKCIVCSSLFAANVLILIFSIYAIDLLIPISLISSCVYKVNALRSAKIETARDVFYKNFTYLFMIPGELFFSIYMISVTWKDFFNMFL